jgi:hypothetical protein
MNNLLAPLALGDCPPKSVARYVATTALTSSRFHEERASASQAATYLERAHNCDFVPGNKIAEFHLGKEQLMPATVLAPFWATKERNQAVQPFVPTAHEILGR